MNTTIVSKENVPQLYPFLGRSIFDSAVNIQLEIEANFGRS